jgi:hypothetical protein
LLGDEQFSVTAGADCYRAAGEACTACVSYITTCHYKSGVDIVANVVDDSECAAERSHSTWCSLFQQVFPWHPVCRHTTSIKIHVAKAPNITSAALHCVTQVLELLKRKRFDQALELIRNAAAEAAAAAAGSSSSRPASPYLSYQQQQQQLLSPRLLEPPDTPSSGVTAAVSRRPAWHQVALAQAGLLLLLECNWDAAIAVLEELDVATWQPCQLFGLFPAVTAR